MRSMFLLMAVISAAIVGISTLATQASAGGSILNDRVQTAYEASQPETSFAGTYFGLIGTYAFSEWDEKVVISDRFKELDSEGFLGGVTLGTNVQRGRVVLGVVGDISWGKLDANQHREGKKFEVTTRSELENLWTARVKLGVVEGKWMGYLTGGLAGARFTTETQLDFMKHGLMSQKQSEILLGYSIGGGVEYKMNRNWSISTEYLYVDLGGVNTAYNDFVRPTLESEVDGVTLHTVRAGINYKF